jgi:hypothetical protein
VGKFLLKATKSLAEALTIDPGSYIAASSLHSTPRSLSR